MRKVLIGFAVLLVVAVAGLLVAPNFVDWNRYKVAISKEVAQASGRDFAIDGDLQLRLLPAPSFTASDVRLSNIEDGSQAEMLTLDEVAVRVAVMPLLRGALQVEEVTLSQPVLLLEKLPDGRGNWEFKTASEREGAQGTEPQKQGEKGQAEGAVAGSGGVLQKLTLERFEVTGGTLIYRDPTSGIEERLDDVHAVIAASSLRGPFTLKGETTFHGQATEVELELGEIVEQGATSVNAGFRLPMSEAKLKLSGLVSRHTTGLSYRGRITGEGENFGALVTELMDQPIPAQVYSPFELSAELEGDEAALAVSDLAFRVGTQSIAGRVKGAFGDLSRFEVALSSPRVDLDAILSDEQPSKPKAEQGEQEKSSETAQKPASKKVAGGQNWPELPAGVAAEVELFVENVIYNRQIVRDFTLRAKLADRKLAVEQFGASLPNGGKAAITAHYGQRENGAWGLSGRSSVRAEDLRAILDWLEIETGDIPQDRLRRLDGKVQFSAQPGQLVLNPVSVTLDVSHLEGAATIALRKRPGIGARLEVDRLDLDAYLPYMVATEGTAPTGQTSSQEGVNKENQQEGTTSRQAEGGAFLQGFDANLDVSIGELVYMTMPLKGLRFDGTLQQGNLTLRRASLDDLYGSSLSLSGDLSNLATEPAADIALNASLDDLPRLAGIFAPGTEVPALGRVNLDGTLQGTAEKLNIDMAALALGGDYRAKGLLQPKGTQLFDGLLVLNHPDLAALIKALSPSASVNPRMGGLKGQALLSLQPTQADMREIDIALAGSPLRGKASVDWSGTKPAITADLDSGPLDLNRLLPRNSNQGAAGDATGGGSFNSAGLSRRWSHDPIDTSALQAVDATVTLDAEALLHDEVRLDGLSTQAELKDGILQVNRFDAMAYGGAVAANGALQGRERLVVDMTYQADKLESLQLFRQFLDSKRVSGPLSLSGDLHTSGNSEAELVQNLNGMGKIDGLLTARVKQEEVLGGALLGALGGKVQEIQGFGDATITLLQAFGGKAAKLNGTYEIRGGVLVSNDLRADGSNATVFNRVKLDLPAWLIDSQSDLFRAGDDPTKPYIQVFLTGPLDEPNPRVNGQFLQSSKPEKVLKKLLGVEETTQQPQATPEQTPETETTQEPAEEPSKKEKTRELIKGILKELGG